MTTSIARLNWSSPQEVDVTIAGRLELRGGIGGIPKTRGMYIIARKTRTGILPVYVGLASRSIQQRLKQHLKSERMIAELVDGRRSKRLFFYAELTPGDLEFAKRYLPSFERALILCARKARGATLNRHQRQIHRAAAISKCCFENTGHEPAWADWAPDIITTELLPARGQPA